MTGYKSLAGSLGQIPQHDRAAEHNSVYGGAQCTNGKNTAPSVRNVLDSPAAKIRALAIRSSFLAFSFGVGPRYVRTS